jgi:adenosylcobinamide-GDP ribazoletransferase
VAGLLAAARYLTIVPLPGARGGEPVPGRAAAWFPVVGLALGAALVAVDHVGTRLFPPLLAALLTVTAWKLLTGGLHLDGVADCLDGLMGRDAAHRLVIMRDSRIGAFGAIGLILFLMLEIAAVAELPAAQRWRALLVAPVVARAMPAVVGRLFPPARPEGHAAAFAAALPARAAPVGLALAAAVAALGLGAAGMAGLGLALVAALGIGRFMTRRLRGVTGDVHGAAVEAAELLVLLTAAAWARPRP